MHVSFELFISEMKHGVGSKKKSEKEKHLPCNQNHLGMKQKS